MRRVLAFTLALILLAGNLPGGAVRAYGAEATEPEVVLLPEETIPEETAPEETVPEETVPEETVPEETVPEETAPEETAPEETVPEETVPEETVPEETVPEETSDAAQAEEDVQMVTLPQGLVCRLDRTGATIVEYTGTDPVLVIPGEVEGKPIVAVAENVFAQLDVWHLLFTGTWDAWEAIDFTTGNQRLEDYPFHEEATGEEVIPGRQVHCFERPLLECTICGDRLLDSTYVGSCDLVDGVCTVCGYHAYYSYEIRDDQVVITDYLGRDTEVTVPETIQGLPVTTIGADAFLDGFGITRITLPDTVTTIGDYAFAYCYDLKSINIPDAVTQIGSAAFQNCEQLQSIVIPAGVEKISTDTFFNCYRLTSVTLPQSLRSIGDYAFGCCEELTELQLPDGVTHIGDYAFRGCKKLRDVTLPTGLRVINEGAFSLCGSLEQMVLPHGVEEIGVEAFFQCSRMGTVGIPATVTVIGKQAFDQCGNLRCVSYGGTQAQKDAIVMDSGNAILQKANWHLEGTSCAVVLDSVKAHSSGKPILIWDRLSCIDSYEIYRATASKGPFTHLDSATGTSYVDESAQFGKRYYYKLVGINAAGEATPMSAAKSGYCRCAQPQILAENPNGVPVISWEKVENAVKYEIWRSESDHDTFKKIATTSKLTYTDTKAPTGQLSYYKVRALGSSSNVTSNDSQIVSTGYVVAKPVVKLTLTSAGMPSLTWSKITGATFYDIYRSTDGDVYEKISCQTKTTFTDQNAPADTECYYYVVAVAPGKGCSNSSDVLFVDTACPTPTLTSAAAEAASGLPVLSWKAVNGAAAYEISRAAKSGGTYEVVGVTPELTFTDTTAAAGKTYYYKVAAVTPKGTRSNASAYKSCKCLCAAPVITVELDAATGKPGISWEAVGGAKKYEVYRATSETGKYSKLTTTTKLTYTDTKASVGKTCYYKVKALASSGSYNSAYSQIRWGLCVCAQPKFTVKLTAATGQPELSWSKVSGAGKYEILRRESETGEDTRLITQTGTSYKDTSAQADTTYFYQVNALASNSLYNSRETTPVKITAVCAQPVITTDVDAATGLPVISWKAVAGAAAYEISRSTKSSGTYTVVGSVSELTFTDTTATPGKTAYYKVTALSPAGNPGAASGYKSGKCVLAAPVITADTDPVTGKPVVGWESVGGAKKYEVYRATSLTGKYSKLTTTSKLTYTDTKASAGKTCYYKVKAVAASGSYNSGYSDVVSGLCVCARPKVTGKVNTAGQPQLSWGKISGAGKYEILRSSEENGSYTSLCVQTGTSYTDTSAAVDSVNWYKVRALGSDGLYSSEESLPVSVRVACPTPVIRSAAADEATGKPRLEWDRAEGIVSYEILRAASAKGTYTQVGTTREDFYVDTDAQPGKTYYYKLIAVGVNSRSAPSAYKSVKCLMEAPVLTISLSNLGNVNLSWTEVEGAVKYEVYRSTRKDSGFEKIKTSTVNYTFNIVPDKYTLYYYKVRGVTDKGVYSPFSLPTPTASVSIRSTLKMELNSTTELRAEYMGTRSLSWSSSDETVLFVKDGRFCSRTKEGTAVVTVTDGNVSAECVVTVAPKEVPNYFLRIFPPEKEIFYPGESLQLEYVYKGSGELTWSSTDPEIVSVSETGMITTLSVGEAMVTVSDGEHQSKRIIRVYDPAEKTTNLDIWSDHFFYDGVTKVMGDYLYLKVETDVRAEKKNLVYTTTDQGIVSVEWNKEQDLSADDWRTWLVLHFNSPGTATVTLSSDDREVVQTYTIHVKEKYDCDPGKTKLTPEEFAYYATQVGVEMGHTKSKVLSGYLYAWYAEEELTFEKAVAFGRGTAHRVYQYFTKPDHKPMLIVYVEWDEEMEQYLFYTGY